MNGKILIILILPLVIFQSCKKNTGTVVLYFSSFSDDKNMSLDTCYYENAAGNIYKISDIQFFISDISLIDDKDNEFALHSKDGIHYYDERIEKTHSFTIDDVPNATYKYVRFTFGLKNKFNYTNFFLNPPENNMSWPDILGGGYHHLKINGWWIDENQILQPFNLHLGKIIDEDNSISDNTFDVCLPIRNVIVNKNSFSTINISFNVQNWFKNPNIYDFNHFGGSIMSNIEAQKLLIENGNDVFSIY